jgi:hypothetical protein
MPDKHEQSAAPATTVNPCPECGATDKKSDRGKCSHFWHDLLDGLGNAIGEAKFGE